jgi:hypothetical protein
LYSMVSNLISARALVMQARSSKGRQVFMARV